jgi:hypothetical protein
MNVAAHHQLARRGEPSAIPATRKELHDLVEVIIVENVRERVVEIVGKGWMRGAEETSGSGTMDR